jgi:hypothetical protein
MGSGGSLRQVRLGNVEAAHKNKIIAMGRTTSSLNAEVMARLRPLIGSGHDASFMVNASLMAKPLLLSRRQKCYRQHDGPSHNDQRSHGACGDLEFFPGGVIAHSTPLTAAFVFDADGDLPSKKHRRSRAGLGEPRVACRSLCAVLEAPTIVARVREQKRRAGSTTVPLKIAVLSINLY